MLPVPMMNIINGGAHADNPIDIQEFMIMPVGAPTMADAVRVGSEVFQALKKRLADAGHATNVGDEGGFAPNLKSADDALAFIMKAIEAAGYKPGDDVVLALDSASTEFFKAGKYAMEGEGKTLDAAGMVKFYEGLCANIRSCRSRTACPKTIGMAGGADQGDRQEGAAGRRRFFVTNPKRLANGIKKGVANSILVKVNQIGTLSETLEAVEMAQRAGYTAVIRIAQAKPKTRRSPILPWQQTAASSRPVRCRAPTSSPVQPAHPHRGRARADGEICRPRRDQGGLSHGRHRADHLHQQRSHG